MVQKNDEAQLLLAFQAMERTPKLSARAAARIYNVSHEKLSRREVARKRDAICLPI